MTLATSGLIIIQDRKLLLAFSRNKECYYLPGGKIDAGESAEDALCREIEEELNVRLEKDDLRFYVHITAAAYGEQNGTVMEQDCFIVNRNIEPKACAEIGALKYFSLEEYLNESANAPGATMVLEQLKSDNFID